MVVYKSLNEVPKEAGKYVVNIPLTVDITGMDVGIGATVIVGDSAGPTLTVLSGLHGNEWLHLTHFHQLMQRLAETPLAGRVVIVPMANVVAFGTGTRFVLDDSDNPDANRAFPVGGPRHTWLSNQVAGALADEIFPASDCLLDFHLGMWGSTLGSVIVGKDYSDPAMNARCRELALVFGVPLIFEAGMTKNFPGPGSGQGYAGEVLGIPSCGSMLGGAGFDADLESLWLEQNVQGIWNVMTYLGMVSGPVKLPEQYLTYEAVHRVSPRTGGLLVPVRPRDEFGREVAAGELLGRVLHPVTLDVQEELRAPVGGYLSIWARTYPIKPGGWAFCIVPKDHPGTRWMDRPDNLLTND